ncbi:hypothetical protein A3I95_02255 [Candidatus Nomurabacteria bacterium RIFCSPLOWO2_02_FULL_44_12]|uniref:ZIP family metal transporter n=1 Tax=Candidatus Nomurabacteria bacterium RIFCSPLOWO2_12_FULL_44_11 TaxID=1801796 RepID=A0A1F6Y3D6_9BACT|nr:MAG: hypothetical protein A3E95_01040 [Candidatus Nomurabacteria bacterium RIFCSPHIGHO2_12_FULL_44_22b]OGJ00884.1 MAG: hypothetical protein A3G53_02610 [Candidatus Nomurabacteria bacterium RIFCSPLOWO2_12_FULL_44_11]OGJ07235.1 MAG: hypothetical protein A3I95_02255 [Candidatus Nomurabacteria bacterium RIFCSPLOWO2_02_FULL_44_12]
MATIYLYTFASVLLVSFISFIGVFTLSLKAETLHKHTFFLISIAVGALLGDALIHLIPEALKKSSDATLTGTLIIAGVLFFFVLEKIMHWHHHGEREDTHHIQPVGKLVLFSDGIHNFMDGIIIGASFLVSVPVGLATTLAVILHEIPQEVGDFAVLINAGYTKSRALWLNFVSALAAVLGAIVLFTIGNVAELSASVFLPMAAGGFIYIAVADLIPELQKTTEIKYSALQTAGVIAGVLAMILLTFLE